MTPARHRVLVGFGDSLAAVEVVRSLRGAGHRVVVFAREGRRIPLDLERGISVVRIPDPGLDLTAAADGLARALSDGVDAVMPLDDMALALLRHVGPAAQTPSMVGPSSGAVLVALDKRLQLQEAARAGFAVPETVHLEGPEDLPDDVVLPVVVKPALAVEQDGNRFVRPSGTVCSTREQLTSAARGASPSTPRLLQPYVRGVGVGVFGIGDHGRARALSGHERVRMMNPSGSGASACRARVVDPLEVAATRLLVEQLGWSSLFMIELLRPTVGPAWFMELNGRAWGSMALARRQGHEYPAWAVAQALPGGLPESLPDVLPIRGSGLVRHLGRELVHLAAVLRLGSHAPGWPTRAEAVRTLLLVRRSDRWYNLERGGFRVFAADVGRTLADQIRSRRG